MTDPGVFLDLHKGSELRSGTNFAAIKVDEMINFYVLAEDDIIGNDGGLVVHLLLFHPEVVGI